MRRPLISLLSALAVLMGTLLVSAPAQAAAKPVSISSVTTLSVGWAGTAKHSVKVKKKNKKASVKATSVTVYSYAVKKRIATSKKSVKLKPGKYKIKAKARYKLNGKAKLIVKEYVLRVEQGECATRKDAATLVTDSFEGDELDGDTIEIVQQKLRSEGELVYSATLRELLEEVIDDPFAEEEEIDEARELLETLSDEELDAEAIHWRDFAACGKEFGIDAIFLVEDGVSSLMLYLTPDDYL